jgi:hypothetical protein
MVRRDRPLAANSRRERGQNSRLKSSVGLRIDQPVDPPPTRWRGMTADSLSRRWSSRVLAVNLALRNRRAQGMLQLSLGRPAETCPLFELPGERVAAFLTFFDHNPSQTRAGNVGICPTCQGRFFNGEGRLPRATIIEDNVATKTAAVSAAPRRHLSAHRNHGTRSESRSGQIGGAVVCG